MPFTKMYTKKMSKIQSEIKTAIIFYLPYITTMKRVKYTLFMRFVSALQIFAACVSECRV